MVCIQLETMDFFSDTQETASHFADYVEDLQDVFRCHGVDFGSPEDFFAFARTVKYHGELRGDVLRVVKSVMESETNTSFRTILTVIAVASGGPEVATSGREMGIPVKQVIESLIGVGACRQLNADHPDGLYSDLTMQKAAGNGGGVIADSEVKELVPAVALDGAFRGGPEATGIAEVPGPAEVTAPFFEKGANDSSVDQSLRSRLPSPRSPSHGDNGSSNGHQGLLNDYGGSNTLAESTLAESLTRLELNSLQLKIYLDSIDQRISRMEPRLENVAPSVLSTPAPHPTREDGAARYSATVPAATVSAETVSAETIPAETVSAATGPQLPHNDPPVSNQERGAATAGRATGGPLAVLAGLWTDSRQFYSSRSRGVLSAVVFVGVLLLAASLFWRFGRDTGHAVNPVTASVTGGASAASAANTASAANAGSGSPHGAFSVGDPSTAPSVSGAGKESRGGNSTTAHSDTGGGGSGPSGPVDAPTASSNTSSNTLSSRSPSSEYPASDAAKTSEMATDTSEVEAPAVRTYKLSSVPSSNHLVNVSSGVMAANLLSGPKPGYPALASLTHTQGNVVMQAVISKSGTVEHLRVIKGHRLLRGAAKSAVRNWRYRPYKIGGVPVEVATIVSVDFSLHR